MLSLSILLICGMFGWIRSEDAAKTRALDKAVVDKELAQKEVNALVKSCAEILIESERRHKAGSDSVFRVSLALTNAALEKMTEMKNEIKRLERRKR